jgi:hypothetical protein
MALRRAGLDRETAIAIGLAALAALRVFLFAAAFPLFSNVDEHKHIDMVLKYARGYLPGPGRDAFEPETGSYLGLYGTPEYLLEPGKSAPPPTWRRSPRARAQHVQRSEVFLARRPNKEAHQPPVYYVMAGAWLQAGQALGLTGGRLLYWVRGLNALAGFLLVLVAYVFLRDVYREDAFVRLAVPALLVVFPMDALYYITRDAFSPLLAGLGFCLALRLALWPGAGLGLYLAAGLVTAAAFLAKYMNAALLVVTLLCTVYALARRPEARSLRGEGGRLLVLWLLVLLPVACWLTRNQLLFGELTATSLKVERLGWGTKSIAEYWDHPIFTPSGFAVFVSDLVPKYWRGELAWHRLEVAGRGADLFYTLSTLLCLSLAALGLFRSRAPAARLVEGMGFVTVLGSAAGLALLSLMYVFTETSNPPAHRPYFSHGRLISGTLLPFVLLYVRGIEVATARLPGRIAPAAAWGCVAAVSGVVAVSEIGLSREVFASAYNWFHLP